MQFIDLGAQRARIHDRLKAAMDRVVEEGRYILGPQVAEFEAKLADYVGVKHVVACANGTDALLLPLYASGIGPGDAVFVPSFTFAATAEVVALAKAEPIFVDVDAKTYNIDIESLEAAIAMVKAEGRLKPKAIIPVDLFGLAADYDAIIFGTPTRFGNMTAQMRNFLDQTGGLWAKGALAGKVGSVFASTATQHGGQETTITSFHTTLLHHGMVIVGVPYTEPALTNMTEITGGTPYGATTLAAADGSRLPSENELKIARTQGRHVAEIAAALKHGRAL